MIPRLHKRGQSFKGACSYILHDAGQTSADRVAWTLTCNLASDPAWAWHEMYETWANQAQLKALAGQDARGRKNNRPVLHYTLSWAATEKPSPEHTREAALASLQAMGLQEHEAVIAAHSDKQHMHVHIVVNTVHPQTGLTAPMKFTKLALSNWAEAYERAHGIHCEERIKNNEERRRHAAERSRDATGMLTAASRRDQARQRPYVPVKHRAVSRKQWFERKDILDRMKAMRAALDRETKAAREATWARQSKERDDLDRRSQAAIDHARAAMKERFRPQWRDLYRGQKKEERQVGQLNGRLLDRAAFVYLNRDRLGLAQAPLSMRQMLPLIRSGGRLARRLVQVHDHERRALARRQKIETKVLTDRIWENHRAQFSALRDRQAAECDKEREELAAQRKGVSFAHAKASLILDHEDAAEPERGLKRNDPLPSVSQSFGKAADADQSGQLSPSEQIKRDMDEWRKRNEGRDFGRDM